MNCTSAELEAVIDLIIVQAQTFPVVTVPSLVILSCTALDKVPVKVFAHAVPINNPAILFLSMHR